MNKKIIIVVLFLPLIFSGCKNIKEHVSTKESPKETENKIIINGTQENQTQQAYETNTQLSSEENSNVVYDFDGTNLKKVIIDGKIVMENDYNDKDFRIAKRGIDDCKFTYDENKNLIKEERNGKIITYFYKEDEEYQYWHIIGFSYDGSSYYYTRDDLSRINGIKNENGDLIARYEYGLDNNRVEEVLKEQGEEWVCTDESEFIGNVNRIRYRESYYDIECDLYYDNRMFSHAGTNKLVWNDSDFK